MKEQNHLQRLKTQKQKMVTIQSQFTDLQFKEMRVMRRQMREMILNLGQKQTKKLTNIMTRVWMLIIRLSRYRNRILLTEMVKEMKLMILRHYLYLIEKSISTMMEVMMLTVKTQPTKKTTITIDNCRMMGNDKDLIRLQRQSRQFKVLKTPIFLQMKANVFPHKTTRLMNRKTSSKKKRRKKRHSYPKLKKHKFSISKITHLQRRSS